MTGTIESHDDDSVTLTCGSITATIRGDSHREAWMVAHVLMAQSVALDDVVTIGRMLDGVRRSLRELEEDLKRASGRFDEIAAWTREEPGR